jgi:hypothetical protein
VDKDSAAHCRCTGVVDYKRLACSPEGLLDEVDIDRRLL